MYFVTTEFFSRIEITLEIMKDFWSANQGANVQSSNMVEILLSGMYWKGVPLFVVTDTDCDKPHIGTPAWGNNIEWNKEYKINGGNCHLPISHLST